MGPNRVWWDLIGFGLPQTIGGHDLGGSMGGSHESNGTPILFCFCKECAKWAFARCLALQAGPNQSYQRFARKVVLTSIIITNGPPFEHFGSMIHVKRA